MVIEIEERSALLRNCVPQCFISLRCSVMKVSEKELNKLSGADALRGNTRTHPEHDG